jgi:hypothetical protein
VASFVAAVLESSVVVDGPEPVVVPALVVEADSEPFESSDVVLAEFESPESEPWEVADPLAFVPSVPAESVPESVPPAEASHPDCSWMMQPEQTSTSSVKYRTTSG